LDSFIPALTKGGITVTRYIRQVGIIVFLVLACIPAFGFKYNCECSDMGGQWITSRMPYENGEPTSQIIQENMALQTRECGVEGTIREEGKIFQASFAGHVANNLLGKWSLNGEEGTFNIQLLSGDKDCASFDGWLYSKDRERSWKWTGHKDTNSQPSMPSESTSAAGSQEGPQLLVTDSEGTSPLKQGGIMQSKVTASDPVVLQLKCADLEAEMNLMFLMWHHEDDDEELTENEVGFLRISLILFDAWKKLCQKEKWADYDTAASSITGESPIEIETELQQGRIRAEVVNDLVSLDIVTPDVTVSSQGRNTFGVAYDPESGKSFVAAYQQPILVQPTGGSQAPFTLESGQEVEISNGQVRQATTSGQMPGEETARNPDFVPEDSQGGCYADPITGVIVCVDSYGDSNQEETQVGGIQGEGSQSEGTQDLCFEDPETGEIICTGSGEEPSNIQGGCYQDPATGQYICIN
jgi:hypothetical protein